MATLVHQSKWIRGWLFGPVVSLLAAAVCEAEAQRVVITTWAGFMGPPRTQVLSLTTGREEFGLTEFATGRTVFTADGRFALWQRSLSNGSHELVLYDALRRALVPLPFAMEPLAAHPVLLAAFGRSETAAVRLDDSGLRMLYDCAPSFVLMLDLSADGRRLAALCGTGVVAVVDATTGSVLHTVNAVLSPCTSMPKAHASSSAARSRRLARSLCSSN